MSLTKGTNSYVDVSDGDTYFADKLDVDAWTSASPTQKSQALITATQVLENLDWVGQAVSDTQNLAFPRYGEYFDPRLGCEVWMDGTSTPKRIPTAQMELAYHLLNNDGLLDNTGEVVNLDIGSITLERIIKPALLPDVVRKYINPLLLNRGSRSVWRI